MWVLAAGSRQGRNGRG